LLVVIALVVAIHALLLFGLPKLAFKTHAGHQGAAFVTRLVAPPPAPEEPATPTAAVTVAQPQAERPQPAPRPKPRPAARAKSPPQEIAADQAGTPGEAEAPISLLPPPPLVTIGGGVLPAPIKPPLPAESATAALRFAAGAGDAPVRVAPAARITYRSVGQFGGQAIDLPTVLNWRQDGQSYEARWEIYTPLIGERTRTATGLLSPQGLVPVVAALKTPTVQDMRFDYAAQQVHFGIPDTSAPLRAGMQDRLSVLLQLGALLAGDAKRYPVGTLIELPAAHPYGAGTWRFAVEAEEQVTALQGQELPTLRLTHYPESDSDARIQVWLGRTIDYLPVRLRITESNGDTVEHTMQTAYTQQVPSATEPPAQ
jgi:hypothetical protein